MGASWKKTSKDKRLPSKPPPLFNGVVDSSAEGRVGENGNKKSKIFSSNSSSSCFSKLPLADKKVTVDGSRRLLQNASSKALIELASTDLAVSVDELSTFTFPFENAVFEGGGVKGIAYVGAVKCLNDVGIRLKRFAGSSIGATIAGFLSVGYTADEMVALYLQDLSVFIRDSKCELLCFLPRLISKFGMNPGLAFLDWYGRCLAVKTQDPNITFKQIYERFGTELCVVVLNMNTGKEEYFHPKTTPDIPVRVAVRMSISVPGVLEPISLENVTGSTDLYIDGGVICNYPVYVFDGWWLSMQPKDHIYERLCSTPKENICDELSFLYDSKNKFTQNDFKTIGFKQTVNTNFFNESIVRSCFNEDCELVRNTNINFSRPDTKLVKKRVKHMKSLERATQIHSATLGALLKLFKILRKCYDAEGYVLKDRLYESLSNKNDGFTESHMSILFGKGISAEEVVKDIPSRDNLITTRDLDNHLRGFGVDVHKMIESSSAFRGSDLGDAKSFWSRLQRNVTCAARRGYLKPEDAERTVSIHTDYIQFLDFDMCPQDKEFLIQQGYKYTFAFLQKYMQKQRKGNTECKEPCQQHLSESEPTILPNSRASKATIFYIDEEEERNHWMDTLGTAADVG